MRHRVTMLEYLQFLSCAMLVSLGLGAVIVRVSGVSRIAKETSVAEGDQPWIGDPIRDSVVPFVGRASMAQMMTGASHLCAVPRGIVVSLVRAESGGNPRARSSAGAVGLTQLMPATARMMGLRVGRHDDRLDPWRSLVAGSCYLRLLYDQFGTWPLALAAYHGGPGNMSRGTTPAVSWAYASDVMQGAE